MSAKRTTGSAGKKSASADKKGGSSAKKGGTAAKVGRNEVFDRLGPRLRAEMEELCKSEDAILRALKDPESAMAFTADPLTALQAMGVDVPPITKQRLKAASAGGDLPDSLLDRRSFRLPNGQVVTANVTVRFTGAPDRG